ncbi:MAG: SDR family oxidoreductase [Bacteroidetes bacterium]|nr:SDR family oxidoreductase [Bacteroidota bacterium]
MAYTAAKSAVKGMTRAMAVELSPFGVRVNCIAPAFMVLLTYHLLRWQLLYTLTQLFIILEFRNTCRTIHW